MAGYTPAFSTMYDGTLFGKWPQAAVWASLLPLLDARGELNMTYEAISARTGWPMDLLRQGIAALMEPDADSQSQDEQGRRLVLLDPQRRTWGWRAVNHAKYRERARKQNNDRARVESGDNAERMRRRREAERDHSLETRPAATRADPLSDSDTNTDTEEKDIYTTPEVSARREESEQPPKPKRTRTERAARPLEPEELGQFRFAYPPRAGAQPWRRAIAAIRTRLQEGDSWADIIDGAKRYRAFCEATGKVNTEYVMQVATFVGPERHYMAQWTLPATPAADESPEQQALRRLADRRAAIGLADFRAPFPKETSKQYRDAQDIEWNRRELAKSLQRSPVGGSPLEASVQAAQSLAGLLRPIPLDADTPPTRRGRT